MIEQRGNGRYHPQLPEEELARVSRKRFMANLGAVGLGGLFYVLAEIWKDSSAQRLNQQQLIKTYSILRDKTLHPSVKQIKLGKIRSSYDFEQASRYTIAAGAGLCGSFIAAFAPIAIRVEPSRDIGRRALIRALAALGLSVPAIISYHATKDRSAINGFQMDKPNPVEK